MGVSTLPHQKMLNAIEILGTAVAPIVRNELGVTPVGAPRQMVIPPSLALRLFLPQGRSG
jgi:hypothetical protein